MQERQREVILRFLAEPTDVNFGGKVHGGAVMKWIDLAAYACAAAWSGKYCVTAYVGGMHFVKPILVGNMVEVEARVVYTGRSSMHITVDVSAGDPKSVERQLTTHCIVIMVAMDEGKSAEIPQWYPTEPADIKLRDSALRLVDMRREITKEMQQHFDR